MKFHILVNKYNSNRVNLPVSRLQVAYEFFNIWLMASSKLV